MPAKKLRPSPAPAPRPARSRRAAEPADGNNTNRRADLVRVAAKLFREKGFDGTTIRDIADAVGMRSGSPFYHFANKHELLMAVMEEGLRLGLARTQDVLRNDALPPVERFRQLVRVHYGILHDTGSDFIPVMLYDWRSLPAPYRRRIIELKDRYDTIWQQTIAALHAEGRLRADPKLARLMILGAINFSATWYRGKPTSTARAGAGAARRVDLDELAAQTVALVLHDTRSTR
ncbi:MAG TPA: TetR/AcrR family transcriptional regulator [Burkholderiaceae bacterium]|nr:TetR/AcrR family transcriptional regulator [Burkholderiaceae bacterium]